MKKRLISLLICTAALWASCSVLDIEPKTEWTANSVPTELSHLEGLVYGGYNRLYSALLSGFVIYGDERADVYYNNSYNEPNHERIVRNRLDPNMSQANWSSFYQAVKQANVVIFHTPEMIRKGTVTAAEANSLLGQAYCQRAFAYFWIVRIWGDAPIVTRPLLHSEENFDVARSPVSEVLDLVHHDLDSALRYIPAQVSATSVTRSTFSPVAVRAIKAHAYMWEYRYQEAIGQLNLAIPTATTLYRLANLYNASQIPAENTTFRAFVTSTEFSHMFNSSGASNNLESIFELVASEEDGDINNAFDDFWVSATTPYFAVREDFSAIFPSNDFRFYASIGAEPASGKRRALKWVQNYARGNPRNIVLIRLADLKLLRAEARAMIAGFDPTNAQRTEIMADVNDIIVRARGPQAAYTNYLDRDLWDRESFIDVIKTERRRELAFEGQRWFDLVRWGDAVSALAAMRESTRGIYVLGTGAVNLDPRAIVWPIYLLEIRRSKHIVQNEYYR